MNVSGFLRKLSETQTVDTFRETLSKIDKPELRVSQRTQTTRLAHWLESNRGALKSDDISSLLCIERRLVWFSNVTRTDPSICTIERICLALLQIKPEVPDMQKHISEILPNSSKAEIAYISFLLDGFSTVAASRLIDFVGTVSKDNFFTMVEYFVSSIKESEGKRDNQESCEIKSKLVDLVIELKDTDQWLDILKIIKTLPEDQQNCETVNKLIALFTSMVRVDWTIRAQVLAGIDLLPEAQRNYETIEKVVAFFQNIENMRQSEKILKAIRLLPEAQRNYKVIEKLAELFKNSKDKLSANIFKVIRLIPENQRNFYIIDKVNSLLKAIPEEEWFESNTAAIEQKSAEIISLFAALVEGIKSRAGRDILIKKLFYISKEQRNYEILSKLVAPFKDIKDTVLLGDILTVINYHPEGPTSFEIMSKLATLFKEIVDVKERRNLLNALSSIPEEQRDFEVIKELRELWQVIARDPDILIAVDRLLKASPDENKVDFINTLYQLTIDRSRAPDVFLEKAYEHVLRQLEHVLNSANSDAAEKLAASIYEYQSKLLIHPEHPLTQAALHVLTLTADIGNRKNPFTVYTMLQEESKKTLTITLPQELIGDVNVMLNRETFIQNSEGRQVTFDQLPKNVSAQYLSMQFEVMKTRLSTLGPVKKEEILHQIQISNELSFDQLYDNIVSDFFIQTLTTIQGNPEDTAPIDFARYLALANYLNAKSCEIPEGKLLSPREEVLLAMSNSIQFCSGGKKEGIALYYNFLPEAYKYHTDVMGVVPDIEKPLTYIQRSIQDMLGLLFSSDTPLLQELTGDGDGIQQLAHVSIFTKNRIGSRVGFHYKLIFDQHTHNLYSKLLETSLEDTLNIFYKHVTPTKLIQELKNSFERDKENVEGLIVQLSTLIETRLGKTAMDYETIWTHDERYTTASFSLTDEGAKRILLAAGYLEETKGSN